MTTMPAVFLGHGAPPLLDDQLWMSQLSQWAGELPRPRAILVVSAHWESAPATIGATRDAAPLVYDFYGFPQRFYTLTYPSPGAPDLAREVAGLLPAGQSLHQRPDRGLDHGAFVPLLAMYPAADIPVLQLSLPTLDPRRLLEFGRRLAPLRRAGVLVMGSGFLTHGLPFIAEYMAGRPGAPSWSTDFDAWAARALADGDIDALLNFKLRAPGMPYAHPTTEHLAPLFVALGAADAPAAPDAAIDGFWYGLSKRSLALA